MATPPYISPAGSLHRITARTTQGEYLLRPDGGVTQNLIDLLGYLQLKYGIEIHAVRVLSNHIPMLVTDVRGDQIGRMNNHFFSLTARSLNCFRDRKENFFNNARPNCVTVAPFAEDIVDKSGYITDQPVAAGLVSHAKKWTGVLLRPGPLGSTEIHCDRPGFFYDPKGPTPASVTLRVTLPRALDMEPETLCLRLLEDHNARERQKRAEYRETGQTFLGMKRVLRKSVNSRPGHELPMFERVPHVACKRRALRKRYLRWRQQRNREYRKLLEMLRAGDRNVVFPVGTFAMHVRFGFPREDWSTLHPTGCPWQALLDDP